MTDPIVTAVAADAEKAASTAVASAETAVTAQVVKQEGWLKANWKAIVIGLVFGLIAGHLL
jgi:hypothetical protein